MRTKKQKAKPTAKPGVNGGLLIPKDKMTPSRAYPDRYGSIWSATAGLAKDKSYALPLSGDFTVNALRCALVRVKRQGRVPSDLRMSSNGKMVYFYRA